LLQELTIRVAETELVGLAIYDGLRVVSRALVAGQPECLLLIASRSVEPANEALLGILKDMPHALGAIDGICAVLGSALPVVDLRACIRPATTEEAAALSDTSAPPPGAERMTPQEAVEFLRSRGVSPNSQGLNEQPGAGVQGVAPPPGQIIPPQGGTGVVRPNLEARPITARP
jgi:hypothetical protein